MNAKMKYIIPFFLLSIVFACKESKENNTAYLGGKIINPKSDYIILFNHDKVLDSIKLNEDHTFSRKFNNIKEGLYYFKHGPEHQYIYLEPNDSLLIRLNTWDFDESLVFSGSSANKNNILINSFLDAEKKEQFFHNLHQLPPSKFKAKIDSLKQVNLKQIEEFKINNPNVSNKFLEILNISFIFPLYSELECYTVNYKPTINPINLPSFFKHRKSINMGLDSIMFFSTYSDYVIGKIYNDVYQQGFQKDTDEFTVALLKAIDNNISSEKLKNTYLKHATVKYFYRKSSCDINKNSFYTFFKLNTSIKDKKEIQRLLNDAKQLRRKDSFPSFNVMNSNGDSLDIRKVIKGKKSAVYFRNTDHSLSNTVASRTNFLSKKVPGIQFVIINMIGNNDYYSRKMNTKEQYYLKDNSKAYQFLTSKYPRTVLVSENGVIQNGFSSFNSMKILKQLQELEK
ncbi:conserved protein of unknown function [Tenacibaculum maritimum NCIMB 2154]|uniref:Lipoprotein n=3 Tax=Tenacibaculum maritimum TaxID=107401 RepID=A0A2H1E8S7_9FLAO|nr:conserved protein of unknown function [Tenacibaculum maritimum NCIMB 2154]